eukprot:TRINITY_DN3235_c0_g1_i1.p1 TRINITY_DN3235_c0_g1~~TRINITY_DN3235_c0_g1_i1.p1  ORF type:complete len:228 (-),score=44.62 TRINITY_DN3235_c0_g1_i1:134-817(-)
MDRRDAYGPHEAEFNRNASAIRNKINGLQFLYGEKRKVSIRDIERQLDDLKSSLRYMENLVSSQPLDVARSLLPRQRACAADALKLQRELEHAILTEGQFPQRDDMRGANDIEVHEIDLRKNLLSGHERLIQTGNRLEGTVRVAQQTEEVGVDILLNLEQQREQLVRTHINLGGIDDNVTRSRRILRGMYRRVITNNIILVCIAIFLFVGIALVVWFKWIQHLIHKS